MIRSEFQSSGYARPRRSNDMKRIYTGLAIATALALGGWASPAKSAPPTVTPSPGYDARLQEQRAAQSYHEPVVRTPRAVSRRHIKRVHGGAH
jgi:hypothetical protein